MTAAGEPKRFGLELRLDAEPIEGRLYNHDDGRRLDLKFSGWLGLMSALEAARGDGSGTPQKQEEREAR